MKQSNILEAFHSPWWLPGAHLQTIFPAFFAKRLAVSYCRERWRTPDDDFIDLDWLDVEADRADDAPLLVIFHGLEGSSSSRYARGLMALAAAQGWLAVVPNFRGCSGTINHAARFYHSGDSAEIDWILRRLQTMHPERPMVAVGISLGGNVLLKWLGEQGAEANAIVTRAAAISAPVDLAAGARALRHGFNLLYTREFMRSLVPKSLAKLEQFPQAFDRAALLRCRDLTDFDHHVTAPLHGFDDANDYYRRSSSKPWLRHITVPTLLLNARNDPFLPGDLLPTADEVSTMVERDYPATGGHVGFWAAGSQGSEWMPQRVIQFLSDH